MISVLLVEDHELYRVGTSMLLKNAGDKIDAVLTHPVSGLIIFAGIMFLVFYISQSTLGTWIADWLVGWIETFQEWVGGMMEDANPLLYALLVVGNGGSGETRIECVLTGDVEAVVVVLL